LLASSHLFCNAAFIASLIFGSRAISSFIMAIFLIDKYKVLVVLVVKILYGLNIMGKYVNLVGTPKFLCQVIQNGPLLRDKKG